MSTVVNPGGIRAGCIYRISLRNFVTYKEVTILPGKALNFIIGPNGTGKSTLLSAIILGLGGKLSAIGRADKLEKYVKTDCNEAKIEIELYRKVKQKNVIITRTINRKNTTTWCINYESVPEKSVQELVASLHIQVENLCQLLPQDKVHAFSQKESEERLQDTLATVGAEGSVEQLKELKSIRSRQQNLTTNLQKNKDDLKELIRINNGRKTDIDKMKERKEMEKQIKVCEKKALWIEFLKLRDKVAEYDSDNKKTTSMKDSLERAMVPLQNELQNANREINGLEQERQKVSMKILSLKEQIADIINSVKSHENDLRVIKTSYTQKIDRHKNVKNELNEVEARLQKWKTDLNKLENNQGNKNQLQEGLNNLKGQINKTIAAVEALNKMKMNVQCEIDNRITPQKRHCQNRIRNLEDVNKKRLEKLQMNNYHKDTYDALMWLRQNRDKFEQPVYEPMMFEINFTDPMYAQYLEATVATRDLMAFTFESTSDMNAFLKYTRQTLKLKRVNAVHSQGAPQPSDDIKHLRYLGFFTYLADTITAPDAILSYLCTHYNIHRIPIGTQHTYDNSDKVPSNIRTYFTENHKFTIRVSRYGNRAVSSSVVEIRPASFLANSADVEAINSVRHELNSYERTLEEKRSEMNGLDNKLTTLEKSLKDLNDRKKAINVYIDEITKITREILLLNSKKSDIINECTLDLEAEKAACNDEMKKCVIKQRKLHEELYSVMKGLQKKIIQKELYSVKLEISRNAIEDKASHLREYKKQIGEMEDILRNVQRMLAGATSTAKQKQIEIRQCCNNKLPGQPGFPYEEAFRQLPSELEDIQEHCSELRTRMGCMGIGDEEIIKQYEEDEKKIQKLQQDLQNTDDTKRQLETKLQKIKSQWLPSLENLVRKINENFSDMFAKLNCAGEVELVKKGGEDDFDKYGIDILVKFRAESQLTRLTQHHQSGGERALTTGVYLMALQALTSGVPFRCVDEINQGMDAVYERRMLEMLVQITTEGDASQYFLLTPKLLPNLVFNEKVMVHTIMNGKYIMKSNDWQLERFVQNARLYRP